MKVIVFFFSLFLSLQLTLASDPLNIIVFGAHPDDCDISAGGVAALFSQMGHKVKFVSLTNGNKGHHLMKPDELAARRKKEMQAAARALGVVYENLDNNDGELMPTIENRKAVIKLICDWKADIVISCRPYDYHPDHRNTAILVQDAAYMISVPLMVPDGQPLLNAPLFLYVSDRFQKPIPFSPDIVVDITSVAEKKAAAICAHESQVFEWLPWNGGWAKELPADSVERRKYVSKRYLERDRVDRYVDAALKWYTFEQMKNIRYVEAFEICEYGSMPDKEKIRRLFPMLPHSLSSNKPIIAPGAKVEKLADGFRFTEGPAVDKKGNIYFTDQPNDRIMKWSTDGKLSVFLDKTGRANGMYFDKKGNLLSCSDMENEIWSINPKGEHTVLVTDYNGKKLNGPNDLWVRPDGGIFFTDPLYARDYWNRDPKRQQEGEYVYFLSPDRKILIPVATDLEQPNGIVGTPDGKLLYVADIKAGKTYVYNIRPDGSLTGKKLFAEPGSDGMTIDSEGNIYLTGNGVTVFNKEGEKIEHIPVEAKWTANVCFGGKDMKTLFITASQYLYGLRMNVKGVSFQ